MKAPVPWCTWCGREKCSCEDGVEDIAYNPEPSLRDRVVAVVKRLPGCKVADVCEALGVQFVKHREEDPEGRRAYDNVLKTMSRLVHDGFIAAEGVPRAHTLVKEPPPVPVAQPKERRKRARKVDHETRLRRNEIKRRSRERLVAYRLEHRLCRDCGAGLAELEGWTRVRCPECSEALDERSREYRKTDKGRAYNMRKTREYRHQDINAYRERARQAYQAKKLAGICATCPQPCLEDSIYCASCVAVQREKSRLTAERRRIRRAQQGVCDRCGVRPRREGGALCQPCLDVRRERYPRAA